MTVRAQDRLVRLLIAAPTVGGFALWLTTLWGLMRLLGPVWRAL